VKAVPSAGRGARPLRRADGRYRWRSWIVVGVLLTGIGLSGVGALMRQATVRNSERQSFQLTATSVTATLSTLLGRDTDFVGSLRALLSVHPSVSATGFADYYNEVAGQQRQIGAVGSAVVSLVSARDLPTFEARRDADPTFQAILGRWLVPVQRGAQKRRYCLLSAGRDLIPLNALTAGLVQGDWCEAGSMLGSSQAPLLASAADSGEVVAIPVDIPWMRTVFLESAVYAHGAPDRTVAERRAAVTGWVLSSFDLPAVIRAAVGTNPGLSVQLYHANPGQPRVLVGQVGGGGGSNRPRQSTRLTIEGNWTVTVLGRPLARGLGADSQGMLVFALGVVISALVALLARSRQRAVEMVAEKTRELRYQALHDPLTGLPNRVLALDRAEQMLAAARRNHSDVAGLYVDLDGFKEVNDTFGHAAGDELLRMVGERLEGVVRESDTAARLAGDEFLVLLDTARLDCAPELVAERLLEALREPYPLSSAGGRAVSPTASIGIAIGRDQSAEALLADADAAMYAAKSSGKDRCAAFEPATAAE
jgi:diguanylate cyclase (GGDEF)-like protein